MIKILIYLLLFGSGLAVGYVYFTNMIRNLDIENVSKGQLIKSMLFRLPIPVIAFFLAGFIAGVWGILALFAGFSVFQIYYLIKVGGRLKEEIEKEAQNLEQNDKNKADLDD
jgi:hypothetical protein